MVHTAHMCIKSSEDQDRWLGPWNCKKLDRIEDADAKGVGPDQIVFSIQFPHRELDMSRWHQFILGTMELELSGDRPRSKL